MNSDKIFYVIVGLVTAIIFFGIIFFSGGKSQNTTQNKTTSVDLQTLLGKSYHSNIDPTTAKVTLVVFSDFQCPACKSAETEVQQIKKDFGDEVAIIYKQFPLTSIHNYAYNAALASEAAAKQNKFFEYAQILFEKQTTVSNPLSENDFVKFATDLNLDVNKFKDYYNGSEAKEKVEENIKLANTLGLNGTPTFYLNGTKYQGNNLYNDIKKLLNK